MWPFSRKAKEVRLTDEEHAAVQEEWKLFMAAAPKEEGKQLYAPKEVADAMQKTIASQALLSLADRYLMQTHGSLANEAENRTLREKAATAAIKAVAIDLDPLNFYKAGRILEKVGRKADADAFFQTFLKAAPDVLREAKGNFKIVVERAVNELRNRT